MLTLRTPDRSRRISGREAGDAGLGVAWLNGELRVCARDGRGGESLWSASQPVPAAAELGGALRTAVAQTGFPGRNVSILLAHSQLAQTFLEIPPAPPAVVRRLVERQVERQKPFPGPAVWLDQAAAPAGNAPGRILHLLPLDLHNSLVESCRAAGLHLASLTPVSEAVRELAPDGRVPANEPVLVAAVIPGALVLSLCQRDGTPCLFRTVPGNWCTEPARIAVEIRRTQLFARQQFLRPVEEVWLAGLTDPGELLRPGILAEGALHLVQPEIEGDFWARRALSGAAGTRINLVTREQSVVLQRRAVSRLSQRLGVASVVLAGGLALFAGRWRTQELADQARLVREQSRLETRAPGLRTAELARLRQRALVEAWEHSARLPLHVWLPGYLAEVLPPGMVLTNLELRAETNGWRLGIAGFTTANGTPPIDARIRSLVDTLAGGPLALAVPRAASVGSTGTTAAAKTASGSWTAGLQAPPAAGAGVATTFQVEGSTQ